jgi:hypothetical protein
LLICLTSCTGGDRLLLFSLAEFAIRHKCIFFCTPNLFPFFFFFYKPALLFFWLLCLPTFFILGFLVVICLIPQTQWDVLGE